MPLLLHGSGSGVGVGRVVVVVLVLFPENIFNAFHAAGTLIHTTLLFDALALQFPLPCLGARLRRRTARTTASASC